MITLHVFDAVFLNTVVETSIKPSIGELIIVNNSMWEVVAVPHDYRTAECKVMVLVKHFKNIPADQ